MPTLTFRPLDEAEFETMRTNLITDFSTNKVASGEWESHEALERARAQISVLLPLGRKTPNNHFIGGITTQGLLIGTVWVCLDEPVPGTAYIYDIVIFPESRGNGFGRELLSAAEHKAQQHGMKLMELNVFGSNTVARSLYSSHGYETTSLHMQKGLG